MIEAAIDEIIYWNDVRARARSFSHYTHPPTAASSMTVTDKGGARERRRTRRSENMRKQ